jgi:hypothetical protein
MREHDDLHVARLETGSGERARDAIGIGRRPRIDEADTMRSAKEMHVRVEKLDPLDRDGPRHRVDATTPVTNRDRWLR